MRISPSTNATRSRWWRPAARMTFAKVCKPCLPSSREPADTRKHPLPCLGPVACVGRSVYDIREPVWRLCRSRSGHMNLAFSDEQQSVRQTFAELFARESTIERVRAAEVTGFDQPLWHLLVKVGALGVGVPAEYGGAGGGLI